ncbi:HAD domain-containing protein [Paucibacter sp. M5-1]|uniref:HAD domain-containing protein n=1 Tax=Paucibacter sp. M5-1 TaxID=3015998 RepID=UPI0022B90A79|nr:HAD domain-containing protein [Paucibacter sp. M5-1]MCZ7884632.1 HAD domain-containing protein [Paucibacter sp. M5-1]
MAPILFLNLGGVCHPTSTQYRFFHGLQHVGPQPFVWADQLQPIAQRWNLSVVLRSTATLTYGFDVVKGLTPEWLQERIAGATEDVVRNVSLFDIRVVNTSFGVITRYIKKHDVTHWVTLSDDARGWPEDPQVRRHLVQCNPAKGLTSSGTLRKLEEALTECKP